MSKIILGLFITFLSATHFSNEDWLVYKSHEGGFIIESPGKIKEVINRANTSLGELEYHIFIYRDNSKDPDNLAYMVSYCDYPDGSIHSDSTELAQDFFEATIDQAVESVNGKLAYSSESKYRGYPGMIWRTDYGGDDGGIIRTKAFIKGQRYYSIQTVCSKDKSMNLSSDKFFNAFNLISSKEE